MGVISDLMGLLPQRSKSDPGWSMNISNLLPFEVQVNPILLGLRNHVPWQFVDIATCVSWLTRIPRFSLLAVWECVKVQLLGG